MKRRNFFKIFVGNVKAILQGKMRLFPSAAFRSSRWKKRHGHTVFGGDYEKYDEFEKRIKMGFKPPIQNAPPHIFKRKKKRDEIDKRRKDMDRQAKK